MKFKRIVASFLSLAMILSLTSFDVLAEKEQQTETLETETSEEANYAEIVFDTEVKTTNINKWYYIEGGSIEEFQGVKASLSRGFAVDISDDFLYNVEEDEEIWITLEYFGNRSVYANIHYETFKETKMYTNSNGYVKHAQLLVNADEEWNTYTYKLTDYKGANGVEGAVDFRLVNWIQDLGDQGKGGPMAIRSIRIERRPWKSPLRMNGIRSTFDSFGNMYSPEDEMTLSIPMKNKSEDKEIKVDWTVEIYNSNEVLIDSVDYTCELAPGEIRTDEVKIPNPEVMDVYWLRPVSRTSTKEGDGWGEPVTDDLWEKTDFSVSFIYDETNLNYNVGINSHGIGGHKNHAELFQNVGVGWVRTGDFIGFHRIVDGVYINDGDWREQFQKYKDKGLKIQWEIRPQLYDDNHYLGISKNGSLYGGTLPRNPSEINHFVNYHEDIVRWLAPYIDDAEIFNEPDLANPQPGGKQWGLITIPTANALRRAAPNITLSGPCAADEISYLRDAFAKTGALDSLDNYTYHVYDWGGDFDVWNLGYILAQDIKNYLRSNGKDDMPIWCTETGYIQQDMRQPGNRTGKKSWYSNTYPDGMPRHVAARLLTLETATFAGFDLVDKWFWHVAVDFKDATEREDSFGIFNTHLETSTHDYTPYTAKPIAVALAATNHFISENTVTKNIYGRDDPTEGVWGFHFYNPDLGKDVFLLQTQAGIGVNKAFNLGCSSVDIYDIYGNHKGTMKSDDGIYSFYATQEGYYVVGNFTTFSEAEKAPAIVPVKIINEGVKNDIVTAVLENNTNCSNYTIEVDKLNVVSNTGFNSKGIANISYQLPEWDYKEVFGTVKVKDAEGNLVFIAPLEAGIKDPVSVTWEPIKLSENSDTRWGIKATVKNHAQVVSIDGEVEILAPSFVSDINVVRRFENLKADTSITYIFKLEEMIEKEFIDMEAVVRLDNGYSKKYAEAIDFTTAKYAYTKPVIDGVQSPGEWTSSRIGVKNPQKFSGQTRKFIDTQWTGPEDFSYSMQLMWDEEYFYFLGVAVDDVQYNAASQAAQKEWALWQGDSMQIGISDEEDINSMLTASFAEIGLGLETEVNEVWTYIWSLRYEKERADGPLKNSEAAVKHYDGYTVYELKVPWSELFYEGYELDPNKRFRIAVLGNESDGDERMALEYGNGIADDKDCSKFARIQFIK